MEQVLAFMTGRAWHIPSLDRDKTVPPLEPILFRVSYVAFQTITFVILHRFSFDSRVQNIAVHTNSEARVQRSADRDDLP